MATDTLTPTIAANVGEAMKLTGDTLSSLERATGLTRSTLRTRIKGHSPWKSNEIALVAVHFGVTPEALSTPGSIAKMGKLLIARRAA